MKIATFIFLLIFSVKLFGQSDIHITKEMEMVIDDFQRKINNAEVLLIEYSKKGNADIFLVSSVLYIETITNPYPSFVFEYKYSYICLYTGLEKFIDQPQKFKEEVERRLFPHLEAKAIVNAPIEEGKKGEEHEIEIGSTFDPYFWEYVFKNNKLISTKKIVPELIDSSVLKELINPN